MKINSIIDLVKDLDTSRQTKNLNKLLIRILLHLQVEFSNFEIVALLAKEQAKMIRPSKALSNHSVSEVFNTILYTFLRGISTEKGIAILDRYLLKYKQKQLD